MPSTLRRPAHFLAALLALAMPLALAAGALAQAAIFVAGTGIGLVPPKGMTPATSFAGLEHRATGATILVNELPPEAYAQVVTTFTPEGLSSGDFKLSGAATDWKVAGGTGGRLLRGTQVAHGLTFRKWVLLAKGPASTAMLTVAVPEAKAGELPDASIEAALRSVTLRAPPTLDEQAAALPFKINDRVNFRLVRVLGGSGLMFTDGPKDVIPDASQPVVIVASSLAGVSTEKAQRAALAQEAFANIAGVNDVGIVSQTMTEKDGVTWSRIEGRGTYRASMEAVSTLQLIRFDKGGYVRVVAISRTLARDNVIPRAEMLADSITLK